MAVCGRSAFRLAVTKGETDIGVGELLCSYAPPQTFNFGRFRYRAKVCAAEFSVTSGTILASRKLSFKTLLLALSVHSVKGKAACQLKRELGVDYKTAFVLLHKLREAVAALCVTVKLDGVVEMDGMHVGGHVRPKNEKAKRVDRRIAETGRHYEVPSSNEAKFCRRRSTIRRVTSGRA